MSYVFRRSQIRLKHHRHMFPFISAITCMLLVQFYSIIVARKWRQEYITYCTELFKHLFSHYDPIHRITNTQSNYHEGNSSFFGPLFKALEQNTRRGGRPPLLFSRARASSLLLKNTGACYTLSKTLSYTCIPKQMSKSLPAETAEQYG